MTLRKIAGLGALLSLQTPGSRLAQVTTLDSGDTPRKHRALLLLVAIPCLASSLCTSAHKLLFAGTAFAFAFAGRRLRGIRLGDALISLIRAGIPIRGSS